MERTKSGQTLPSIGYGLHWIHDKQAWRAVVHCNGARYDLGVYTKAENAEEAGRQVDASLRDGAVSELVAEVLSRMPND